MVDVERAALLAVVAAGDSGSRWRSWRFAALVTRFTEPPGRAAVPPSPTKGPLVTSTASVLKVSRLTTARVAGAVDVDIVCRALKPRISRLSPGRRAAFAGGQRDAGGIAQRVAQRRSAP